MKTNSKQDIHIETDEKPEIFDDATSKLSFKEKMTMFNKKKPFGSGPSSNLKANRNRLTQVYSFHMVVSMTNQTYNTTMCVGEERMNDSRRKKEKCLFTLDTFEVNDRNVIFHFLHHLADHCRRSSSS